MADERVKIIDIQVRYQDAIEGLAKYRASLAEARKYQADLKKELKAGTISQEQYEASMAASNVYIKEQSDQMRTLTKQINNQIKANREQEGSLKQLRAELSNATQKWDAMSRAERESAKGRALQDHINQITDELKGAEEATQRFYRNVGNYKSATEGLENIRVKIADIGKQMLMALGGGSLLAFSKDVIKVTRDFEDGMARVKAVTDATAEDMQKMTDEARKMGRETIYHATDAAQAMENLARGGFDANEATLALSKTLQLAQANAISLDEASDLMIRTMRGFALPISEDEMVHANDVLSKTAASSATNVLELGEALKNAAPFGHALGQSVEEVNAALGVLADVGVRGADAGTALRMVILGLSSPTAKQQKVFKEYGIEINQASLESEGLTRTLQRLKESGIMEASNSAELLANVFGRRATPQVMALVGNIDRLGEKLNTLQEAQGTTERMFEQSYSNVSQAIFALSSAWESFKISLGESNNQALMEPLTALREGLVWIEEHLPQVGNLVVTLFASIGFAKLVKEAQASFLAIRNSAVSNAEAASTTVRTLNREQLTLRKTIAAQEVAIESASGTERTMLEAKVLANKRQLAETEKNLVKAKTTEITMWERAAALNSGSAWQSAMTAASMAVTGFVTAAKTALKGFVFTAVIMLAFEALQKLFSLLGESDGWFGKITSAVTGFIKDALNWLITQFKTVYQWITEFIENSRIMQGVLIVLKTDMAAIGAVFKSVWAILKAGLKEIFALFKGLVGIVGAVGTAIEGLLTFNWTQMKRGIQQVGTSVTNFLKSTVQNAKDAGTQIAESVVGAYNSTVDAFKDAGNSKAFGGKGSNATAPTSAPQPQKGKTPDKAVAEQESQEKQKTLYVEDAKKAKKDWEEAKAEYQRIIKDQNATTEEVLEARKNMQEAQKAYEDLTGDKQSKSKKSGNSDREAQRQAEAERKAFEEAEKAMLDLMKDTAAKRRAQLEHRYDEEIRKLKVRLETEKNLTEDAKEALRRAILLKEQKKNEELGKLTDEELKRQIQDEQKLIESRMAIIKKGSEEELRLKQEKNTKQAMLDQQALQQEYDDRLADAQEKIRLAQEQYGSESQELQMAKDNLIQIEADYTERSLNIEENRRQQNLQLEQQYQQNLASIRQQSFQNQLMELENANLEFLLKMAEGHEAFAIQEQAQRDLGVDLTTQHELDMANLKVDMARQAYEDVIAIGQLETETVEQYNARKLAAEKNYLTQKLALKSAEMKNEQSVLKSMGKVTDSLINLTSELGESDEAFAMLSKMLGLAKVAVNTGVAIAEGVASAAAVPYPGNIAAIASTVAIVLANMATALSTIRGANFAQGGKVTGPGTGTSDSIPANLSNGEFVMTAKATRMFEPLLAAMNDVGAGVVPMQANNAYRDYNMPTQELTDSFRAAASEIRPVVSVVEITERQEQVEAIESLDNI